MENASESQKEDFDEEETVPIIDSSNPLIIEEQVETSLLPNESVEEECQLTVNSIVDKKVDSDNAENIITEFLPENTDVRFPIFIMIIDIKQINLLHREEW